MEIKTAKPRMHWINSTYLNLTEEQANQQRRCAITDPEVIAAVDLLAKILGSDTTGKYFTKFLDNLDKVEITKGHYEIR